MDPIASGQSRSTARMSALVYAMFFVSGAASLIYQTVWIRRFSLVLGGTVFSMSVVISTFMAGLALGAAVLGRRADRTKAPLVLYAAIEVSIATLGLLLNFTDAARARMVSSLIDSPNLEGTLLVRTAVSVLWLGLPCFLIGGTLPVMVRFIVRSLAVLGRQVGALYCVNTLGAAVGALATGLFLIEVAGLTGATIVAALINLLVAITALAVNRRTNADEAAADREADPKVTPIVDDPTPSASRLQVLAATAFFVSGFCALLLEMGWTRLILGFLMSGAIVVSMNLCVVLVGFALGGAIMARYADRSLAPFKLASALFALTALVTLVGIGGIQILGRLPPPRFVPTIGHVLAVTGMMLPSCIAMGATFPVLVRILVTSQKRLATQLGGYYALNTLGAVLGGLVAPFVLVPLVGTSITIVIGALLQLGVAMLLYLGSPRSDHALLRFGSPVMVVLSILVIPARWDIYHRTMRETAVRSFPDWSAERAFVEGPDSTVVLYEKTRSDKPTVPNDDQHFRVQVNASTVASDTGETKLMAHLPLLAVPDPKRALVICFGVGNTFRSALAHDIAVDVVDINPAIPPLARIHQSDPSRTFEDRNGHIYINDGRNFLQVTKEKYDMITVDPAPPLWAVGFGNIQSREFYQLISDRLTDAGVAEAWMLSSLEGDFQATLAAWRAAFPHVAVFSGMRHVAFHVLGSRSPIRFSEARMRQLHENPRLRADIEQDALLLTPDLFRRMWVTDEVGVDVVVKATVPLTDDDPFIEYRLLRGVKTSDYKFPWSAARPFPGVP